MKTEADSLGEEQLGKLGEEDDEEEESVTERKIRVHRLKVRFGQERRASRLPCFSLSLSLGDNR